MDIFKKEVSLVNSVDFSMKNSAPFASNILFHKRSFVILDHSVNDSEFTVKINYNKKEFGHLIVDYVNQMIREIKDNKKLNDAGWDNTTVFIDEKEVS